MEALKQTINFDLVSPEEKLVSGPVKMAVIPGEEGEMGIGAGQSSFIVALKPGVVKLYENDNETPRKIFIAGGFADVTAENCAVLAEEAIDVTSINQAEAEQAVKAYKEELALAPDAEKSRVARALMLAKAKLSAVSGKLVI